MENENIYVCQNIEQVYNATDQLDKASLVDLKVNDGGVIKDVETHKGVYNVSKGKFCSSVAPYYNLIQHKQYFDLFAESLDRLNIKYTMTIKSDGNHAYADIDFINKNLKFDNLNEEFTTGIRLVNSYNKTTGVLAAPRFTRLFCTNGMILTRDAKVVSLKHTSRELKNIHGFIENKINAIIATDIKLQGWVADSMKDTVEWKICYRIIEKLFKQLKHREEILKRLDISIVEIEDKKTKKKSISYVADNENIKTKKFNRWEIYNAITQYISHGEHITPHIENLFHKHAEKLLITKLEKMPMAKVKI